MAAMPNIPKISLSRSQIIMIVAGLVVVVVVATLFIFGGSTDSNLQPVTLKVWGTDTQDAFEPIINGYKAFRPNATVEYTQVPAGNYDAVLLSALASGRGPDVFMIGNHDLLSHGQILAPAPVAQLTTADYQAYFPQAAAQDFIYGGYVYAAPLYMDTLALLYNRQMFDRAGVALPPVTWQEVVDMVPRLRTEDGSGRITRSAIALGGSERSVDHATDILNLIMMQNGTTMAGDDGTPSFASGNTGADAFRFYLQFADVGSPTYTWSDAGRRSVESFAAQETAMVLAYPGDVAAIRRLSPFLDFGIAPVPQTAVDQAVNYSAYQGLGVWTGSPVQAWGWDFVIFASTNQNAQAAYLAATGRSPALRTLIAGAESDPSRAVFARAALSARSWKMGDYDKIRTIFSSAIQNVLSGAKTPSAALRDAEAQVKQTLPR